MQTSKFLILGCAGLFAVTAMAASEPVELADLRAKFDKAMDRATEALTIFWPSYKHQLEELKSKAQSQGNLEGVLAVETEMKLVDKKSIGKNSKYEPLKSLQAEYAKLRPDLEKQVAPEKKRLYEIYYAALQSLEVSLTKESRLDDAVAVRSAGEEVMKLASSGVTESAPPKPAVAAAPKPSATPAPPQPDKDGFGVSAIVGHNAGGEEFRDTDANKGVLVGFEIVMAPFNGFKETVRGVAPIYTSAAGESKGLIYGSQKGRRNQRVVAKSGYAVGKVTVQWEGNSIRRMKVRFNRLNGRVLDDVDNYESPWVGVYGDAKEEEIDLKGKVPMGMVGRSGLGLNSMAILFSNQ